MRRNFRKSGKKSKNVCSMGSERYNQIVFIYHSKTGEAWFRKFLELSHAIEVEE